jgi:hypothetical protein
MVVVARAVRSVAQEFQSGREPASKQRAGEKYPETGGAEMRYAALFEKTNIGYSTHVPTEDGEAIPEPKTLEEYIVAA